MTESALLYVDELIADAKLIAGYGQRTGAFNSGKLAESINDIEVTARTDIKAAQLNKLQREIVEASRMVPSSILSELRSGGAFHSGAKKPTATIITMISVSVILMVMTGHLTQLYNRGTALLADVRTLQAAEPERQFGQLARQLFVAMKEIANDTSVSANNTLPGNEMLPANGAPPADGIPEANNMPLGSDVLQQQAYFQIFDDLRSLDKKLRFTESSIQSYILDTKYPIWGMQTAQYYYYVILKYLGLADGEIYTLLSVRAQEIKYYENLEKSANQTQTPTSGAESTDQAPSVQNATANGEGGGGSLAPTISATYANSYFCSADFDPAEKRLKTQINMLQNELKLGRFAELTRDYYFAILYLTCYEQIAYGPYNTPSLDEMGRQLERILSPYSLWILPGIYGALGALIFHLRMVSNPLLPNPPGYRIIHRVALGSLAGMILAWFWLPDTAIGGEIANAGFGLFSLAFIFGFSLDIFFTMLDRFVSLSVTAVGKIGGETPA